MQLPPADPDQPADPGWQSIELKHFSGCESAIARQLLHVGLEGALAALNRLSPEHRVVLVLKDLEGQKYEDIAQVLDVPIGTVMSRLHRGRRLLKAKLAEEAIA